MLCMKCRTEREEKEFKLRKDGKPLKTCNECRKALSLSCRAGQKKKRDRDSESARLLGYTDAEVERKRLRAGRTYQSREFYLSSIGFSSYSEYLASPVWRALRKKVYAEKGRSCVLCGGDATELHHNRYHANDLTGETTRFIVPICRGCHESIEFDGSRKVTLEEAADRFVERRRVYLASLDLYGAPAISASGAVVFPFGKYAGKTLKQVKNSALRDLVRRASEFDPALVSECQAELARRKAPEMLPGGSRPSKKERRAASRKGLPAVAPGLASSPGASGRKAFARLSRLERAKIDEKYLAARRVPDYFDSLPARLKEKVAAVRGAAMNRAAVEAPF